MNAYIDPDANRQTALVSDAARRPLSGAETLALIATWDDLPVERRQLLANSVQRAAEICAVPLEAMVMSCAWLNEKFYARAPKANGLETSSFNTLASWLRLVLERLGRHAPRDRRHEELTGPWRDLFELLPDRFARAGLIEFLRYCANEGIAPDRVRSGTLEAFEAWARENILRRDIRALALLVEKTWNHTRVAIVAWPQVELLLPRLSGQFMVAVEAFPASFAGDLDRFAAELAGDRRGRTRLGNEGDGSGTATGGRRGHRRAKPARPATVETRLYQIRLAASALVQSGVPIGEVTTLRTLVEPLDHADRIFEHFWAQAGDKPTSYTAGIAAAVKRVACVHCDPPSPSAARITEWAREMTPEQQRGLSAKNRARLAAMIQPSNLRQLLNLPEELRRRAHLPGITDRSANSLMMAAVAIEILLHCPLRLENLHTLRVGVELLRLDPRSELISHLAIKEERVKNGQPIEWAIRPGTAELMRVWMIDFAVRPDPGAEYFLFPGRFEGCVSSGGLRRTIMTAIRDTIGIEVNPHLFRHFAVWLHLRANPGDYETARRLLGHSTITTTIRFYAGLEAEAAAQRHDDLVERERRAGRSFARAAFRVGRGRKPKGGKSSA